MKSNMPKKSTSSKPTCDLCCDTLEKEHETLKCEGECGSTVHRYCAGITKGQYDSFSDGHAGPFVCQWCSMKTTAAIIRQLQTEVASLRAELTTTKMELAEAKQRERSKPQSYAAATAVGAAYSLEPRRGLHHGPPHSRKNRTAKRDLAPANETPANVTTRSTSRSADSDTHQTRVNVEGARKVWGTHPHATTKTVENAIARFCKPVQGLRIKRKTSTNENSGKVSWWFVIHADESVLCELDDKWNSVNMQTNWILKHCTKPATNVPTSPASRTTVENSESESNPGPAVQLGDQPPEKTESDHAAATPDESLPNSQQDSSQH